MKINKKEMINIIKEYYGFNTKDANFYIKNASYKTLENIKKGFENNAKKNFYND